MTAEERAKDLQNRRLVPRMLLSETGSFDPMQQVADTIRAAFAEEREAIIELIEQRLMGVHVSSELGAAIRARGEPRPPEGFALMVDEFAPPLTAEQTAALLGRKPADPQIIGEKLEELLDHLAPALVEQGVVKPVTAAEILEAVRRLRQQAMCELTEYEDKKRAEPKPLADVVMDALKPELKWTDVMPPEMKEALVSLLDKAREHGGVTMPAESRPIDDPENWKMSVVNDPTNFEPAEPQPDAIAEPVGVLCHVCRKPLGDDYLNYPTCAECRATHEARQGAQP